MRGQRAVRTRAEAVAVFAQLGVEVTPDLSLADLRRAYRKLARDNHPDMPGRDPRQATKILADLNGAYEVLTKGEQQDSGVDWEDLQEEMAQARQEAPRGPGGMAGYTSPREAEDARRAQEHFFRHGPPNPAFGIPLVVGGEHYPEHPTADAIFFDPAAQRGGPREVAPRRGYIVLLVPVDLAGPFMRCMQGFGTEVDFGEILSWCQEQGLMAMFRDMVRRSNARGLDGRGAPRQLGRRDERDPAHPGEMRATANTAAMWNLLAGKLYGADTDVAVLATREALQNSRDAIDRALKAGKLPREGGRFDVRFGLQDDGATWLEWVDNGIGMSPEVVRTKFLSIGDTTKTSGEDAGGFGIAKAIILGCSSTFRWEMHTQDWIYTANGFDAPVRPTRASFYMQGVRLRVYDVLGATRRWGVWSDDGPNLQSRLQLLLSTNNLAPRGRHAGVRLYLNDREVGAKHQGRGIRLQDSATVDGVPQTSVEVRGYKVPGGGAGAIYARLDGLVQFRESIYGSIPLDLVVDVSTRLSPRDRSYPFDAARMKLSGPVGSLVNQLERQAADVLRQSSEGPDRLRDYDTDEAPDSAERLKDIEAMIRQYQQLLESPEIQTALRAAGGAAAHEALSSQYNSLAEERATLLRVAAEERDARARRDREWFASTPRTPRAYNEPPPPAVARPRRAGLERLAGPQKAPRKLGPEQNPFGPLVALIVDTKAFPPPRLRKYTANPEKWLPLALLWDSTCRLVLKAAGKSQSFRSGFIFEDGLAAAQKGRNVYINPDWFQRTALTAYGKQPLQLAVVLHGKACHELTHLLGEHYHDTDFVIAREHLADASAATLYPITLLIQSILGISQAPGPDQKLLARLLLGAPTAPRKGRRDASAPVVALRRRLAAQVEHLPGAVDSKLIREG